MGKNNKQNNLVVLIKIDAYTTKKRYLPYGLMYIANSLERAGYEVKILHNTDQHFLKKDLTNFLSFIKNNDPLFIGFSVNTGRSTQLSALFSKEIKRDDNKNTIVWGGVHPTILPKECLLEKYIDFVVLDEGEESVVELAQALQGKRKIETIRGIGYKKNDLPIITGFRPKIENLDKYRPSWHLVDIKKYLSKYKQHGFNLNRMVSYLTSRGCPYRCAFCYNRFRPENRKVRCHSINRIVSDIKKLKEEYGVDCIWFNDDNFFVNQERAFEIIKKIGLPWFGEARVNSLTNEKTVKRIKKSNCICTMSGAESGCDRILTYVQKDITTAQIIKATKVMSKYKAPLNYTFIVGFPGETWEEIIQTIHFIHKLEDIYDSPKFLCRVGAYIPYPGSPLYETSVKMGFQLPTKTENWGSLERLEMTSDLPWVRGRNIAGLVRYTSAICMARKESKLGYNVLNKLYKYRLGRKNFNFPFEINILYFLVRQLRMNQEKIKNFLKKKE